MTDVEYSWYLLFHINHLALSRIYGQSGYRRQPWFLPRVLLDYLSFLIQRTRTTAVAEESAAHSSFIFKLSGTSAVWSDHALTSTALKYHRNQKVTPQNANHVKSRFQPFYLSYQQHKSALNLLDCHIVASELKDPIWHSLEWQIGSFSFEATICFVYISNFSSVQVVGRDSETQLEVMKNTNFRPITFEG